jgi:hypothetical protein
VKRETFAFADVLSIFSRRLLKSNDGPEHNDVWMVADVEALDRGPQSSIAPKYPPQTLLATPAW